MAGGEYNVNVIMKGAGEAAARYGGGGDVEVPGIDQLPAEIRAGFSALQKDIAGRVPPLDRFFKSIGIEFSLKSMLKQSQIFTSYVGTIFQLFGALVDVTLAPLLPYLIPVARWLGQQLPKVAAFMQEKVQALVEWVTPFFQRVKELFSEGWERGWDRIGDKIKSFFDSLHLGPLGTGIQKFTSWIGDNQGWTIVATAFAAAVAAKFVFKLPVLTLKLAWETTKLIAKGPAAAVNLIKASAAGGRNLAQGVRSLGGAGYAADDPIAAMNALRRQQGWDDVPGAAKATGIGRFIPDWLKRPGMMPGRNFGRVSKGVGYAASSAELFGLFDELLPQLGIPGLASAGGERANRQAAFDENPWDAGWGQGPTGISNWRAIESVSGAGLYAPSSKVPLWARILLGGIHGTSSVFRSEGERKRIELQQRQAGTDELYDPMATSGTAAIFFNWLGKKMRESPAMMSSIMNMGQPGGTSAYASVLNAGPDFGQTQVGGLNAGGQGNFVVQVTVNNDGLPTTSYFAVPLNKAWDYAEYRDAQKNTEAVVRVTGDSGEG